MPDFEVVVILVDHYSAGADVCGYLLKHGCVCQDLLFLPLVRDLRHLKVARLTLVFFFVYDTAHQKELISSDRGVLGV